MLVERSLLTGGGMAQMQRFPDGRLQVKRADRVCWAFIKGEETPLQAATRLGQYFETSGDGATLRLMQELPSGAPDERAKRPSCDVERLVTVDEADAVHKCIEESPEIVARDYWGGIRSLLATRPSVSLEKG